MQNRTKAYLALLTTALIWGVAPPIIKHSLNFVTPVEFLTIRFLIVSLIIFPFFILKLKKHPFEKKDWPLLLLVSLCGTSFTLGFIFWGLSKTSSLDSAVIVATAPLMIVFGGAVFLKEIVTGREKLGLGLAFLGTLVAVVSPVLNANGFSSQHSLSGNALIFISNISWAAYSLLSKKLSKKYPSFNITALSFFVGLISFLPLFFYQKSSNLFYINPQAWPAIIYMSTLGSIIAYFTYTYGVSLIEASEATLFTYLQPIFTAPLAVFWLKETVSQYFIFGAILIIIGVLLTSYKFKKEGR